MEANRRDKLILEQLDKKMLKFSSVSNVTTPNEGWIRAIRTGLKMTMKQLAVRLGISTQGVKSLEDNELRGATSINTLREVANALDLQLIYGFVPRSGSLDELISIRARTIATKIVTRTNHNMRLEDQELDQERIAKSIEELTLEIKNNLNSSLWD